MGNKPLRLEINLEINPLAANTKTSYLTNNFQRQFHFTPSLMKLGNSWKCLVSHWLVARHTLNTGLRNDRTSESCLGAGSNWLVGSIKVTAILFNYVIMVENALITVNTYIWIANQDIHASWKILGIEIFDISLLAVLKIRRSHKKIKVTVG